VTWRTFLKSSAKQRDLFKNQTWTNSCYSTCTSLCSSLNSLSWSSHCPRIETKSSQMTKCLVLNTASPISTSHSLSFL
jgi:hypothetical protein